MFEVCPKKSQSRPAFEASISLLNSKQLPQMLSHYQYKMFHVTKYSANHTEQAAEMETKPEKRCNRNVKENKVNKKNL